MKFSALLKPGRGRAPDRPPKPRGIVARELLCADTVKADNLALVADLLEHHGISFFVIGLIRRHAYRVGILEPSRDALSAMLSQLQDDTVAVTIRAGGTTVADNVSISRMDRAALSKALGDATLIKVCRNRIDTNGRVLFGMLHGCDIEILSAGERGYRCRHYNAMFDRIEEAQLQDLCRVSIGTREYPFPRFLTQPFAINFRKPVDIVYTWVDHRDPRWQADQSRHLKQSLAGEGLHPTAHHPARFQDCDELKYSLRSVAMFAEFVRTIFIVSDDQVPTWLNTDHPAIRMVRHREIYSDPAVLPVFNSHSIETQLHHIPELSEHFLYLNDDIFFGRAVSPTDFFLGNGIVRNCYSASTNIPIGPVQAYDRPVDAAAKNNRAVLQRLFGVNESRKLRHVARPLRRSLLHELEAAAPEEFRRTMGSRFRHPDDLSVASSLASHYAYHRGQAVPAKISYRYVGLDDPDCRARLDALLQLDENKRPKLFCLNLVGDTERNLDVVGSGIKSFLQLWFPHKSEFEC